METKVNEVLVNYLTPEFLKLWKDAEAIARKHPEHPELLKFVETHSSEADGWDNLLKQISNFERLPGEFQSTVIVSIRMAITRKKSPRRAGARTSFGVPREAFVGEFVKELLPIFTKYGAKIKEYCVKRNTTSMAFTFNSLGMNCHTRIQELFLKRQAANGLSTSKQDTSEQKETKQAASAK